MVAVRELLYVVIGSKNVPAWSEFATKCIGMTVSRQTEDIAYLRLDERFARIIVLRSDDEDLHAIGWLVSTEAELDAFASSLAAAGLPCEHVGGEEAAARNVLRLVRTRDPDGIVHEVAWGTELNDRTAFRSPWVLNGFKAGTLGLGHLVLSIEDLKKSNQFFRDVLEHKVSAHLHVHGQIAVFLRCNPRHHSIALSVSHRPKRLQHIQIEYNDFDDLMRAHDHVEDEGAPLIATLGKHNLDWVTSFYVRAPSNVTVEFAHGARLLADEHPTEFENFTGSIWGHRKGMENA